MSESIWIYLMIFMPVMGAFVSYLIGRKSKVARDYFFAGISVLEFVLALMLFLQYEKWAGNIVTLPEVCGMGLNFVVDGFRVLYAAIATFM